MHIKSDGGSTKVEWVLTAGDTEASRCVTDDVRCVTEGINPSLQKPEEIRRT